MQARTRWDGIFLAVALTSAGAVLVGCGGGGSESTTDDVAVTVIDGVITNAMVCMDKNNNGACDAGEPSGRTDATGRVTLKVDKADTGRFPILAVVGTDASDADTGPVLVPFTMKTPADRPALVSPLTTLVQTLVEGSGLTSAAAEIELKNQTGVVLSLFDDFTKGSSVDHKTAGALARLIVVTTQQQTTALVGTIGANALDGSTITKEKLDQAIQKRLLERLPSMAAALPAIVAISTMEDREDAIEAQAGTLVAANELTTDTIGTVVAINNLAPVTGTGTATALQQAQALIDLYSASMATSVADIDALEGAFVDRCYLDDGNTIQTLKARRDENPALSLAYNRHRVGSTRTNLELVAERTSTNPDGSTRRELEVKYQVNFTDGTSSRPVSEARTETLISGSSHGTAMGPGTTCATPQVGNNLRFLGNRRIVQVAVFPQNQRNERYTMAAGAPFPTLVDYNKHLLFSMRDYNGFAQYMVVTGPGLPIAGMKMLSPRILRGDPLMAGKRGHIVDWKDRDSFRYCRTSNGSIAAADVADCVAQGATSSTPGAFYRTAAQADEEFAAMGFVAGGVYTAKVYNDDGWKTVNGQATQTPIATYTTALHRLPYSAVALAGTGPDNDLYPRLTTTLSKADIAQALRDKMPFSTGLGFTALGTMPDAATFGWGEISLFLQGDAAGVTSTPFGYPRSRQSPLAVVVPTAGDTEVASFSVPAPTSLLVTPRYAEIGLYLYDRRGRTVSSIVSFETQ